MYGCYVTVDDNNFLDVITDELDQYNSLNDSSFVLLFPSLSSRHRLLLHRLREKDYPNLFSFSVGEEKSTRRAIICLKSQLMDEVNIAALSVNPSASPKTTASENIDQSNSDTSTKRRPAQALYKPPRRSRDSEFSSPIVIPPTVPLPAAIEVVQQNDSVSKPVKTKPVRPSTEPYVPPSRRSQPGNKEAPLPVPTPSSHENKREDGAEEEEEEEWEKLLNSSENLLTNDPTEEIRTRFKENVQIKKPSNDYSQWSVEDIQTKETDLAHVIEVSNFPSTFRTEDLFTAFEAITRSKFDIKWVDDTHALIVFPDVSMALDALQMEYPMFKVCSMSQASSASKKKAKNTSEFLQPYKSRPQTSSLTANRRICAALGLKNPMTSDKTKTERQKIEGARQQKVRDKEEQQAVWDGGVLPAASTT